MLNEPLKFEADYAFSEEDQKLHFREEVLAAAFSEVPQLYDSLLSLEVLPARCETFLSLVELLIRHA